MRYKVAVLMGGRSLEREVSLASGKNVCASLEAAGHRVVALDVAPDLVPRLRSERPDVAYIALHGKHGEDGTVQSLLEYLGIPHVGASARNCRVAWDKATAPFIAEFISHDDLQSFSWPHQFVLTTDAFKDMGAAHALDLVAERMPAGLPVAVKPAKQGSALGVRKVERAEDLADAMLTALSYDDTLVVEEWIDGVELSVSVLGEGFDAHALPPVEIVPRGGLFDFAARMEEDGAEYYAPVRLESLSPDESVAQSMRSQIEQAAVTVHRALGFRDMSRVDMIWDGATVRILDCNVSPGMTERSLLPMAAAAAGIPFDELCSTLVEVAVERG